MQLRELESFDSITIQTHDNPDADAIEDISGTSSALPVYTDRIYKLTLYWEDSFLNEQGFCGYTDYVFAAA